ncbi:MAG: HPr family phosphocarrier protein [Butyrivibrio sp.]
MKVNLNSVEKVKTFVNEVANFDTEIDLVSSRYVIDAKSIMGILSLDLSKPIEVEVCDRDKEAEVMNVLQKYAS